MSDQQRDGITPFQTVSPDQIGNWYDGPETFVIAQAKDVQLGAQTYALTQPQAQQAVAVPAGFGAPDTFGSILLTAIETIATFPLAEQDNMVTANMRHVARMALDCRPSAAPPQPVLPLPAPPITEPGADGESDA